MRYQTSHINPATGKRKLSYCADNAADARSYLAIIFRWLSLQPNAPKHRWIKMLESLCGYDGEGHFELKGPDGFVYMIDPIEERS